MLFLGTISAQPVMFLKPSESVPGAVCRGSGRPRSRHWAVSASGVLLNSFYSYLFNWPHLLLFEAVPFGGQCTELELEYLGSHLGRSHGLPPGDASDPSPMSGGAMSS